MKHPKTIEGNVSYNGSDDYSQVEEIGGYLYCNDGSKVALPNLKVIGGGLTCYSDSKVTLPRLKAIGGDLYCSSDSDVTLPKLKAIGGALYCNGKVTAPNLKVIGGCLDCSCHPTAKVTLHKDLVYNDLGEVRSVLSRMGYDLWDNILSRRLQSRLRGNTTVHRIQIVGHSEPSWCIQVGETFSHGETLKEARASLVYKISDRDTSKYKDFGLDKVLTKKQAIESYRVITGACEFGTRGFVESRKLPAKASIRQIIRLTKGQWGNEVYAEFFAR